jgi:hypothetical protein|tara:strand:- start:481 stop:1320 length:840 start_codon:yes stop_codon:yes gene_type:complete
MNKHGRSIDKTFLSIDKAEERGLIHRDYIAHCLRWSHVADYIRKQKRWLTSDIVDVGPGKELPLAKTLYVNRTPPRSYTAMDVSKLEMPEIFKNASWKPYYLMSNTDAAEVSPDRLHIHPNIVTCFEVLEHVEPAHARNILIRIRQWLTDDGVAFISTPNWDPKVGAAGNHVNEMTYEALGSLIEDLGFGVEDVFGTFASQKDILPVMSKEEKLVFKELNRYYDSNYISTVFAPLYPKESRNCLWKLTREPIDDGRMFNMLCDVNAPWTSSELWRELDG